MRGEHVVECRKPRVFLRRTGSLWRCGPRLGPGGPRMRRELQEELFAVAPEFFVRDDPRRSAMAFGFDCGDGWYPLIRALLEAAREYRDSPSYVPNPDPGSGGYPYRPPPECAAGCAGGCARPFNHFQVTQVKEKLGGLRFYFDGGTPEFRGMVRLAEDLSYRTCEVCGMPGALDESQWWVLTLCLGHRTARANARREGSVLREAWESAPGVWSDADFYRSSV